MSLSRMLAISLALAIGVLLMPGRALRPVSAGGEPITTGTLKLTATYQSIGIELPFTGDVDGSATARLELRKTGDASWRPGLPLWRTDNAEEAREYLFSHLPGELFQQ